MTQYIGDPGERFASFSDEYLVKKAKRGEHAAYIELSNRHSPMVFRMIMRVTKNREDAEDALQETLMKAFIHLQTFNGTSSFATWLTRIGINSALMLLRKKKSQLEQSIVGSLDQETEYYVRYADPSPGPENLCLTREREKFLRQGIRRLPTRLREVIEFRHQQDSSVGELANAFGISVAATKSRLLRARNLLIASTKPRKT
jgi:RNA polymerase sigma factor (sigma-70 family)